MSGTLTDFLQGFRSKWGALTAAACAGPLLLQFSAKELIAPWPSIHVSTNLAIVFSAIALLLSYGIFLKLERTPADAGRRMVAAYVICGLSCTLLLLLAYLVIYSFFKLSQDELLVLKGYRRLARIESSYPLDYPDALLWAEFQYDENQVWTSRSLAVVRITGLATYIGFFFFLTFSVAILCNQPDNTRSAAAGAGN